MKRLSILEAAEIYRPHPGESDEDYHHRLKEIVAAFNGETMEDADRRAQAILDFYDPEVNGPNELLA